MKEIHERIIYCPRGRERPLTDPARTGTLSGVSGKPTVSPAQHLDLDTRPPAVLKGTAKQNCTHKRKRRKTKRLGDVPSLHAEPYWPRVPEKENGRKNTERKQREDVQTYYSFV